MTPKTAKAPDIVFEGLALVMLQDRLADILQESGPRKTGELVAAADHPAVSLHLAKYALKSSPRFTQTSRKWDLAGRWESPELPFEQILEGLITSAGRPVPVDRLGKDIADILERDPETMEELARKFATNSEHFCVLGENHIGLSRWLHNTNYEKSEDLIFYNYLNQDTIEPYRKFASGLDWVTDPNATAVQMVLEAGIPVPFGAVVYFAWEAIGQDAESAELYKTLFDDPDVGITSNQILFRHDKAKSLLDGLKEIESTISDEIEEEEEAEDEPPTITDDDINDIRKNIEKKASVVQLSDIILQVFELEKGEKAYDPTEEELKERLRHDVSLQWLGAGRFTPAGFIPDEVTAVPETLLIPEYDFATPDGERFDLEMEIAGLESNLVKEVKSPLVQDVGDEDEQEVPAKRPMRADCVLKYHHKLTGTFPMAQIPEGFFAQEPLIQQVTVRYDSERFDIWVNRETRLIYGLTDIYNKLDLPISGGLFHLNATDDMDVFDLEYSGETDETAFVAPGRLLELLQLKEEADQERLPTFELVRRTLERQSSGLSYPQLFVEVNLIRRVSRMLVASLLSGYPCFSRQTKTGLWVFDEKKKDQPFTKSKKKYVVKES